MVNYWQKENNCEGLWDKGNWCINRCLKENFKNDKFWKQPISLCDGE